MQEKLNNQRTLVGQHLFKLIDVLKTLFPHGLWREVMHAHNQQIFIMRAVEDAKHALLRCGFMNAPEIIVAQLLFGRILETGDVAAGGIDAAEDMVDRAILAARIHGLNNDEQRKAAIDVKLLLKLPQLFEVVL